MAAYTTFIEQTIVAQDKTAVTLFLLSSLHFDGLTSLVRNESGW